MTKKKKKPGEVLEVLADFWFSAGAAGIHGLQKIVDARRTARLKDDDDFWLSDAVTEAIGETARGLATAAERTASDLGGAAEAK